MNIKLDSLHIRNFKGIKELSIEADGKDICVRGDNATGKTTVKDAFTWLLFNKNSLGKADFGIKPVDKDGNVIHNLEVSVEAVFTIDGAEKKFKRTLTENWTRKRGAATAVFTGNESNYFINDVPKKKTEYTKAVSEIITEDVFKIITDPLYFNEQMKWQDRRVMLIDICGDISDEVILSSKPTFAPLAAELNGRTVDEYKAILTKDMKAINKQLEMIPVQIAEAERAKPDITGLQINEERKAEIVKEVMKLDEERNALLSGANLLNLKAEKAALLDEIKRCDTAKGKVALPDTADIMNLMNEYQQGINVAKLRIDVINNQLAASKQQKQILSEEWDAVFKRVFLDEHCPVCKRPFPPDEVEGKRKDFNVQKAIDLDRIEKTLDILKAKEVEELHSKSIYEGKVSEYEKLLADTAAELAAVKEDYNLKVAEVVREANALKSTYEGRIEAIDILIENYQQGTIKQCKELDAQIITLTAEKAVIDSEIAKKIVAEQQDIRIAELQAQQETCAAEYMKLDGLMYLAEQFVRTKVDMLNERINSNFKHARFKLFDTQINDGIKETCEVTFDGVPYSDLNNAMRINIGLDVINTLCKKHKVTAPIFIDNAEAVTKVLATDSQQVRLIVDEQYKELTVMKGE